MTALTGSGANIDSILLRFKVWVPGLDRVSKRLYLLGSSPELGAWALGSALEAQPTKDHHIWSVETSMPALARFEWVWLKKDRSTKKIEWERPVKRNRQISCFSGVLHSVWGEHDEVFLQFAANVELTTYKQLSEGYRLVLTGGTTPLGGWNILKALPAYEFPQGSGYWKVSAMVDALSCVDFKWAVTKEKDRGVVVYQEKVPHKLVARSSWMRVAAPWMTTDTVVVDMLPLKEALDSKMGLTDVIIKDKRARLLEIRNWLVQDSIRKPNVQLPVKKKSKTVVKELPFNLKDLISQPSSMARSLEESQVSTKHISHTTSQTESLSQRFSQELKQWPQVFAIKGPGQKDVPLDIANIDSLSRLGIIPEGECRVLKELPRPAVSLWSISMGLAGSARLLPPPDATAPCNLKVDWETEQVSGLQDKMGQQKDMPGDSILIGANHIKEDDGQKVVRRQRCTSGYGDISPTETVPKECVDTRNGENPLNDMAADHVHLDSNAKKPMSRAPIEMKYEPEKIFAHLFLDNDQKKDENDNESPARPIIETVEPSEYLPPQREKYVHFSTSPVPLDNNVEFQDKTQWCHCVVPGEYNGEHSLLETSTDVVHSDVSDFFRSLEVFFQNDLDAESVKQTEYVNKLSASNSASLVIDSGIASLASLAADARMSWSTTNDFEVLNISEDQAAFNVSDIAPGAHPILLGAHGSHHSQLDATHNRADTNLMRDEDDEGFSEASDAGFVLPGLRTASDIDRGISPRASRERPNYCHRVHFDRVLAAPGVVNRYFSVRPESAPATGDPLNRSDEIPYVTPLVTTTSASSEQTLGDLFDRHGAAESWRCWLLGEAIEDSWAKEQDRLELEELENFSYDDAEEIGQDQNSCDKDLSLSFYINQTEENELWHLSPRQASPYLGEVNDAGKYEKLTATREPHAQEAMLTYEPPMNIGLSHQIAPPPQKRNSCSTRMFQWETGDSNGVSADVDLHDEGGDRFQAHSTAIQLMLDLPCDDLSLGERRLVAQALEHAWGLEAAAGEGGKQTSDGMTCGAEEHLRFPKPRMRRGYRSTRCTPCQIGQLVSSGEAAMLDRRARARQAEVLWGQAASSLCQG